jgi:DNA-binding CsgD family transcriptional regulator
MDLARTEQAVRALRRARDGEEFVFFAAGVIDGIRRVLAADLIWYHDVDASAALMLWPPQVGGEDDGAPRPASGRELARAGTSGVGHALVMPLPAPPGSCRRLVFLRRPGTSFGEEERSAAFLLQPHIADALRCQGRHAAARLLTGRQRELLGLVAAGHDNVAIARRLGLSPCTVRKHLENAFARLDVTSRTAAVAKVCPDATWLDPLPPQSASGDRRVLPRLVFGSVMRFWLTSRDALHAGDGACAPLAPQVERAAGLVCHGHR